MSANCNLSKWQAAGQTAQECKKFPYRQYEAENILAGMRDSLDPMMAASMGLCDAAVVLTNASGALVDNLYAFTVINDAVIDTANSTGADATHETSKNALNGVTIPAGVTIYIDLTQIAVSSGVIQAMPHPFK